MITTSMIPARVLEERTRPVKAAVTTNAVQPPVPLPRAVDLPPDVPITTADLDVVEEVAAPVDVPVEGEVDAVPEAQPKRRAVRKVKKD
jgi:hypothetical protein